MAGVVHREERAIGERVVEGQREDGGVGEREPLEYSYVRDAEGAGEFTFSVFANFDDEPARIRAERLDMAAKWNVDQSGRGVARVTGGDIAPDEFVTMLVARVAPTTSSS